MYKRYVFPSGTVAHIVNNKFHREDGPAVERNTGTKEWYINDQLHREDGPAIEYCDGTRHWYINDVDLTEEITQWFEETNFNPDYTTWSREEKLQFKLVWG